MRSNTRRTRPFLLRGRLLSALLHCRRFITALTPGQCRARPTGRRYPRGLGWREHRHSLLANHLRRIAIDVNLDACSAQFCRATPINSATLISGINRPRRGACLARTEQSRKRLIAPPSHSSGLPPLAQCPPRNLFQTLGASDFLSRMIHVILRFVERKATTQER